MRAYNLLLTHLGELEVDLGGMFQPLPEAASFDRIGVASRLLRGYLTADLSYVLFTKRHPHPASDKAGRHAQLDYLAGSCAVAWTSWMVPSLLGIAFAKVIPTSWGLGFAGMLALLGILCSLATSRLRAVSAVVAGTAAVAAYALPLKLNILVGIAAAVCMCMVMEKSQLPAPAAGAKEPS